jgi:pseudaminic acid synthase
MKFLKNIKILKTTISEKKCFIVAEISANHSGNFFKLKKLIKEIKVAGADAIKIQAYEADTITLNSNFKDFKISKKNTWSKFKTLYSLYKKAQTPFDWYPKIFEYCEKIKLPVFASVFDHTSLNYLEKINCPAYKIASPEITDIPLIKSVARTKKPIMISNGLANINDLILAVNTVKKEKNKKLIILKCTSAYPAPIDEINLKTIQDIKKKFKCLVGYSDHSIGYNISIHAASLGISVLEKHVCLKNSKTVDSFFSIDTKKLKKMIEIIRANEVSNGKIFYSISKSSKINLNGRRSVYVTKDIRKGEIFSVNNIKSIRPSFGMHPKFYYKFIGKKSNSDIKSGFRLLWKYIKKK